MIPKVQISGGPHVNLAQKDFIASGGEGDIYGAGDTVYKIYHDSKKMIPQGKFYDLSSLNERYIVNPQKILLNSKKIPVGFTMEWFKDNYPICKVFTNGFRKKSGFKASDAVKLIENMQKCIDFVHSKNCLIVDFNDVNFLIDSSELTQPIFIDVDSYKTPNYNPTAITPYAQDHHTKEFSSLTDWYSFGIIAFQVFIGMHPFKGSCDGFGKSAVVERMKANKSVFNSKVKLPSAAREFDYIPSELRAWMENMFERGTRIAPPLVGGRIQVAKPVYSKIKSSNYFDIELIRSFDNEIDYHFACMNEDVVRVGDVLHVGARRYNLNYKKSEVVISPDTMIPVEITKKTFRPMDSKQKIDLTMRIEKIIVANNIPVIKTGDSISTVPVKKFAKYMMAIDKTWPVMPLSTKMFPGMVYQDVLGIPYIWIPEEKKGSLSGEFIKIPELAGSKIISAKCIRNVAVIIGHSKGKYSRFVLRHFQGKYDIKIVHDIDYQNEPNFTVLDKGLIILLNENSEIEIFRSDIGSNNTKVIDDDQIDSSCILTSNGSQVLFYKGKDLYKLKMRN